MCYAKSFRLIEGKDLRSCNVLLFRFSFDFDNKRSQNYSDKDTCAACESKRAACKVPPETDKISGLKNYLISSLEEKIPKIEYIKTDAPHILNISLKGYRSEVLMNFLETKEIYVSKSSACKQGKRSHVLEAIGKSNDYTDGALRIGLSRFNTVEDIDALTDGLSGALSLAHR